MLTSTPVRPRVRLGNTADCVVLDCRLGGGLAADPDSRRGGESAGTGPQETAAIDRSGQVLLDRA